jgi:hypothetical protein
LNLHGIVSGAIGVVNPFVPAQWSRSAGYTTSADGTQLPTYDAPVAVSVQRQALSQSDLNRIDNLNFQGVTTTVYMQHGPHGVRRGMVQGGDLFVLDGQDWLVVSVPEEWPDWSRLILSLQLS